MKTIEVAGIPFTEEILAELKTWIVPKNDFDVAEVSSDIDSLLSMQSFLINHWDDLNTEDSKIKTTLVELDYLRRRFEIFNTIKLSNNEIFNMYFGIIEDKRCQVDVTHPLVAILKLTLLAELSGIDELDKIVDYGKNKRNGRKNYIQRRGLCRAAKAESGQFLRRCLRHV